MKKLLCTVSFIVCFTVMNGQTSWTTVGNCATEILKIGTRNVCFQSFPPIDYVYDFEIIHEGETMTKYENDLITFAPAVSQKVLIGDAPTNTISEYKLYVEDGILTEMVKVAIKSTSDWSDHVFYDDNELMSLPEVEDFINQYGHLPNIPSAEKLVKEGLDLGEMQAKQMEKIEELTLHLIEKDKEIKTLQKQVEQLSKQMKLLLDKE